VISKVLNMSCRLGMIARFINMKLLVLMLIPVIVTAQPASLLRVLVFSDEDGLPVAGANVVLYEIADGDAGEVAYVGVTNRDGFSELRIIVTDSYLLMVSFIGFETFEEVLIFENGDRKERRVYLTPSVEILGDVVVEGERALAAGEAGIRRISSEQISRIPTPSPGGDLASYLQTVPGVVTAGDRGGELFIRGGTPDQNLVLVDNLPIIKPFHISNLFSAFSDEAIGSVEMYAGGFPAEYLGNTSSVIDVQLKSGNMRAIRASAAISPVIHSLHLEGPLEKDRKSLMVHARKSDIQRYGERLTGESVPYDFYDIVSRYTYQGDNISCYATGVYTSDSGLINPERSREQFWSNRVLGGRCLYYDTSLDNIIEFTAGYTGYRSSEGPRGVTERSSNVDQFYINIDMQRMLLNQNLNYGFRLNYGVYSSVIDDRFTNLDSFKSTQPVARLYISTEMELHENVTIQPGVGTQLSTNRNISFEPRFRLLYLPDGTNRRELSLALGKYNQLVSGIRDERDAGTVFTVLKPVHVNDPLPGSIHAIASYKERLGRRFIGNIESYYISHKFIPISKWTPEARLELETALADGMSYGIDVKMEYDRNSIYFSLGYGWSKTRYEANSDDLEAWIDQPVFAFSPPHDQRHTFSALLGYELAGFTAGARWYYGSGRPFTQVTGFDMVLNVPAQNPLLRAGTATTTFSEPYGARQPVQHQLDVFLKRSFQMYENVSLTAEAGVINTYNRNNIFYLDLNTLQRIDQTPLMPYFSIKTAFN